MLFFTNHLKRKQQKLSMFSINFLFFLIVTVMFLSHPLLAHDPDNNDRFFIPPVGPSSYAFDGQILSSEWDMGVVNWFTFGTEGQPEATVYGRHSGNTLFLAFHFDFETLTSDDFLTICIDPNNSASNANGNNFLRYDIFPYNSSKVYSIDAAGGWSVQTSLPTFIESKVDTNLSLNYWEVEIEIDCSNSMLGFGNEFFGLYFQITDFTTITDYTQYWWPGSADPRVLTSYNDVPSADEWANARLVTDSIPTQPDIYFNKYEKHLRTSNSPNDLIIKTGEKNLINVTTHNIFIPGDGSNSGIGEIDLTVQYRDFGLGSFVGINGTTHSLVNKNSSKVETLNWNVPVLPVNSPDTVSLRAEFTHSLDPITCNNSTRRTMQYLTVIENKKAEIAMIIENSNNNTAMNNTHTYHASTANTTPYTPQIQDSSSTFYFHIDYSRLDPAIPDSLWDIKFTTLGPGDSLITISDRDSISFDYGEKKEFRLEFTAPDYCSLSKRRQFTALRIKVAKKMDSYRHGETIYNRLETYGYCGAYIKVVRKPLSIWGYIGRGIVLLSLSGFGYYLYEKKIVNIN